MGSVHQALCECGFAADITVGGGRETFQTKSYFPFYCAACGLIEVNVAKLQKSILKITCPGCNSSEAVQYGTPPISDKPAEARNAFRWFDRSAAEKWHKCPSCKEMKLVFSSMPDIMFD